LPPKDSMFAKPGDQDTICAVSTAPGVGGIAVLRVSGDDALKVSRKLCPFIPESPESHRIFYGILTDRSASAVDEVLVSYFARGRSFTDEETIEISCHGGQIITATILKELIHSGARLANRGEFTYRAFMNGRIDLVQAESVLSLIESQSRQSAKAALRQLQGSLSEEFKKIEDGLLWILAQLEASIDFSSEGLDTVSPEALLERAKPLHEFVDTMIESYRQGRILRQGLQVALVGRPNAGKSSLLNALLQEDRAIVAAEPGTTRDTVEGRITVNGVPITLVDTAGLRETDSAVERLGISRSLKAMQESDLVFRVMDLGGKDWRADFDESLSAQANNTYFLLNKTDLDSDGSSLAEATQRLQSLGLGGRFFAVSALRRSGLGEIEKLFAVAVSGLDPGASSVVTQARHLELLQKISVCLTEAMKLMQQSSSEKQEASPEFIAFELQVAIKSVHEILGKEFHEQVIDRIFKDFCLGK
jgi:tRNA modification GTPase